MKKTEDDDLLVEAIALCEYYAWTRRRVISAADRSRIREATRVIHRIRKANGWVALSQTPPAIPLSLEPSGDTP